MSVYTLKHWVQLVSDDALEQLRQRGMHRQRLWRQIHVTATPDGICVDLGNVDAEAASGGYWNGSENGRTVKMAWDDLNDVDFVQNAFRTEMMFVFMEIMDVLSRVRDNMVTIRQLLNEVA